jgi:hypothetical protein
MAGSTPAPLARYDIRVSGLDLSQLVGFQVRLFSKQFPGKEVYARVVAAAGQRLTTESSSPNDPLYNLVNHQQVILQFTYRGEQVSVRAKLQKSGGHCAFDLEETATPLSQRRFYRADLHYKVNLAPFTAGGLMSSRLDRLRWMETTAVNFSAGGALINVPTILPDTVRLLINIEQGDFRFPALVMAKVCHGYQHDDLTCRAGVEYVTQEQANRMFSPYQMSELPPVLFSYTGTRREQLNRAIQELNTTTNSKVDTGVENENG